MECWCFYKIDDKDKYGIKQFKHSGIKYLKAHQYELLNKLIQIFAPLRISLNPGPNPIKVLPHKFYPVWLNNWRSIKFMRLAPGLTHSWVNFQIAKFANLRLDLIL